MVGGTRLCPGDAYCPRGTCAGDPGCYRSEPLSYAIKIGLADSLFEHTHTITQDQIDIVRQEYWHHGLSPVPDRTAFRRILKNVRYTTHFTGADLNHTEYDFVWGDPGPIAEALLEEFNSIVFDDVPDMRQGESGPNANAVVVSPGVSVVGFPLGALVTPPCWPNPDPSSCDDVKVTLPDGRTVITVGSNKKAETSPLRLGDLALVEPDKTIQITSGWRNPQRNEVYSSAPTSRHQLGGAVDAAWFDADHSTSEIWCTLLEAAQRLVARGVVDFTQAENGAGTPVPCTNSDVGHIHVDKR